MKRLFYFFICGLTTCFCCNVVSIDTMSDGTLRARIRLVIENPTFLANMNPTLDCDVLTRIDSGLVCGSVRTAEDNVKYASFRGMPYAKQPLRELRFKELQPLNPWAGVRLATKEGPICPQYDEIYGRLARPVGMSESCILANVHVPLDVYDRRSKAICQKTGLPILVFIHGGAFQAGSGNSDLHGPEYLVSKGVIVITFNYRINVFGYLSLNSKSVPGNNGLRDAITLLKWVQRNARAFGGDPENVTLAGQSAGSAAAHLVALSKASVGLMKRVILMSGVGNGGFYTASPIHAQSVANMFLGYVGINSTDADIIHKQLIHTPLDKIMEANRIVQLKTGIISFAPVVEPKRPGVTRILDDYPGNLVKRGRAKDLPMIVGITSIECQYFKQRLEYWNILGIIDDNPTAILPPNITYSVSESEALRLSEITIDKYFEGGATVDKFIKYCSNSFFTYPAFKLAEWTASLGASPVYMYQFDFDSEFNPIKFGKMLTYTGGGAHLEDQTFVLRVNSLMDPDEKSFPPRSRDDLMKYWLTTFFVNFMRCSHPLCDNQSEWPATDANQLNYQLIKEPMLINNNINLTGELRAEFDFQDQIYEMAQ